jgi:hypothetical protein
VLPPITLNGVTFGGDFFDAIIDLRAAGSLYPGSAAQVPIKFLSPELIVPSLVLGAEFTLWEGRTIGDGTVVCVL